MEPVTIALLAASGAALYSLTKRGQARGEWKKAMEESAKRIGGKVSPGPELRAQIERRTVSVKLSRIRDRRTGVAIAEVDLPAKSKDLRLYLGWDVTAVPPDLLHIPEIPYPRSFGLAGRLSIRADDAEIAGKFARRSVNDLVDLRREGGFLAIEVLARGGTLRVALHGIEPSGVLIDRLVFGSVRLGRLMVESSGLSKEDFDQAPAVGGVFSKSFATPAINTAFEPGICVVCGLTRRKKEGFVRCVRCRAIYHDECHAQATGCLIEGCVETRAIAD